MPTNILCSCGCPETDHMIGSREHGWTCFLHLLSCPMIPRPIITLGTQDYPVSAEAIMAIEDAGAEIAAGLVDPTEVIVAILTVEGYGDDMNVRLHRR